MLCSKTVLCVLLKLLWSKTVLCVLLKLLWGKRIYAFCQSCCAAKKFYCCSPMHHSIGTIATIYLFIWLGSNVDWIFIFYQYFGSFEDTKTKKVGQKNIFFRDLRKKVLRNVVRKLHEKVHQSSFFRKCFRIRRTKSFTKKQKILFLERFFMYFKVA